MKRVEKCAIEECIPTPSSCVKWNGGDISFLGICDGDCLNILMEELIAELQKIAGKDLSTFDINSLIAICDKEAPEKVDILSILTLLRDNQLCLKDFIDEVEEQLQKLLAGQSVKVNLKCYTGFNGIGLSLSREQLDQLVIDILCGHLLSMDSIDDTIVRLRAEINEKRLAERIEEIMASTCVNPESLPLSKQIEELSQEVCDFRTAVGTAANIAAALAKTPTDLNPEFGSIPGWNPAPVFWSDYYGNTILEVQNLRERITEIEDTCCRITCDDVTVAFTAVFNEDQTGIIFRFTAGAGMVLPEGFEDCGSTGTITDSQGASQDFDIAISLGGVVEIPLENIATVGDLYVNISAKLCHEELGIQCVKCVTQSIGQAPCAFCELTASGPVTVVYKLCITPSNCIFRSVDMVAGEKFVLPANSEVISVTDDTVLDSSCGDTVFPVQVKQCYQMKWVLNYDSEGLINYFPLPFNPPIIIPEANNAWDNEGGDWPDISITQYGIAGTVFPLGINAGDLTALEAALASSPNGTLLSERKYNIEVKESVDGVDDTNWNGDFNSGFTIYKLAFKAVPEIANSFYLQFFGESGNVGAIPRYFAEEMDCADYPTTSEVASGGIGAVPPEPENPATSTTTTTTSP